MEGIRKDTRQIVERLEGQVARLRVAVWMLFLILVGVGGLLAWQRPHPKAQDKDKDKVIHVEGLVVEDGHGAAQLVLSGHGLQVMDEQGQPRIDLSLKDDGKGQMALKDAKGEPVFLGSEGAITLSDAKKDSAILTTVGGSTLQLRRGDKIVFKQPWDAAERVPGQATALATNQVSAQAPSQASRSKAVPTAAPTQVQSPEQAPEQK